MPAVLAAIVLWFFCLPASAELASYYGREHHGRKTASGERFNMHGMTAAHRTLPFGTRVLVTYRGKSVTVRINDRGPFIRGRSIDLSEGAARALGLTGTGIGAVDIRRLSKGDWGL